MRIVFMGTPPFAATALAALLASRHEVVGAFTQPDKPVGRKAVLTPPPVKTLAEAHGVSVYQPAKLRDGTAVALLRELAPDICVVVAYGRILPPDMLAVPRFGCVNVHASLLPKYRGAGPIARALLNGETETGVTTMHMAEGMDTGDMILQKTVAIDPDEQEAELRARLADVGAALLLETLDRLEAGDAPRVPQDCAAASCAPMVEKEDARVDWTQPALTLHNLVRAMAGWPVAHCLCEGRTLRIHRARVADADTAGLAPGTLLEGRRFVVACGEGALELLEVQAECCRQMPGCAFLCGHRPAHLD